jgi:Tfp pilus assembly protein PilF
MSVSAQLSPFEQVVNKIQLAQVYMEDGALRTAADRLEQAASILRGVADEEAAILEGMASSGKNEVR